MKARHPIWAGTDLNPADRQREAPPRKCPVDITRTTLLPAIEQLFLVCRPSPTTSTSSFHPTGPALSEQTPDHRRASPRSQLLRLGRQQLDKLALGRARAFETGQRHVGKKGRTPGLGGETAGSRRAPARPGSAGGDNNPGSPSQSTYRRPAGQEHRKHGPQPAPEEQGRSQCMQPIATQAPVTSF